MARCGECEHFVNQHSYIAAETSYCNAYIEDDGIGKEVGLYQDASKCPKFKELDRIRTDILEFSDDPLLRGAIGFDEK